MDKQKQIKEMAKIMTVECGECYTCKYKEYDSDRRCMDCLSAEELYNAGYRKIPENAVVLTDDEYERWQGQTLNIKKVRKETAEKFAKKAKESFFGVNCIDIDEWNWYHDKLDEICKELVEGK